MSAPALIDLHCHLLPGLDDGPPTAADATALLHALGADGVGTVVATPHLREDFPAVRPRQIAAHVAALPAPAGAPRVLPGAEIGLTRALALDDGELAHASLGGTGHTVLVETPPGIVGPDFETAVLSVARRGVRVLLAHPERNRSLQRAPARLAELVRCGVLLQVSADSLLAPGRGSRTLAIALAREGLAHVLASDAHSAAGLRPVRLAEAVCALELAAGPVARWMVTEAPAAVLAGEPLGDAPVVAPLASRRVAGLFRRR